MTRTVRHLIAVLLLTLAGVSAAACSSTDGSTPSPESHSHEPYTAPPGVLDADGPDAVMTRALSSIYSWEPVTDTSPTDALRRTSDQLTDAALRSAQTPGAGVRASAEWSAWCQAGDLVTARVTDPHTTIVSPTKAFGHATVIQTVLHVDGGATPYQRFTANVQLAHTPGGWKVSTYPSTQ